MKTLVFMLGTDPILALVRGDHALHERKLARALRAEARPAQPDEVKARLGVSPGSIGPIGASGAKRILADQSLAEGTYVVGANRDGYHVTGVEAGEGLHCAVARPPVVLPRAAGPS